MELRKELGTGQFFTLAFGSIVGVGWVVVLGNWIAVAGPLGAIAAFVLGGLVVMLVGLCYAEMAHFFPVSGGEVAYAYLLFGLKASFATGWLLALGYIGTAVFEAVSVTWIASTLVSGIEGPILYVSRGEPVRLGTVLLGISGMALITLLNYRGVRPAAKLQDLLTYGKIALATIFILAGIIFGRTSNLQPLLQREHGVIAWRGFLAVLLTTPFWLSGFNSVSQVLGEKAPGTSAKSVGRMLLLAIAAAVLFYVLLILACSMTMPWPQLIKLNFPAAEAFEVGLHSVLLARVVLIVALLGNITVWNATTLCGSRVLFALGKMRMIPRKFGSITESGVPGISVLFVGVLASCGILLGRAALLPILNVASSCMAFAFVTVCTGIVFLHIRSAASGQPRGILMPALLAAPVSVVILALSLYEPYVSAGRRVPIEWAFFLGWLVLGGVFWFGAQRMRAELTEDQRRQILFVTETVECAVKEN